MLSVLPDLYKRKVPLLCLGNKWKIFDPSLLWKTFSYGITSALQQMCVQLGKICVQTVVNVQGVEFIAAFTAINRVDDFAMTPQQNIAHASTTFMAQNRGAGKIERMKKGFQFDPASGNLYGGYRSGYLFLCQTDHGIVCGREFRGSSFPGSFLSGADRTYVCHACGYQYYSGIFPRTGRLEGHVDQYHSEYVCQIFTAWLMIHVMHGGFDRLAWANFFGWVAMLAFQIPMITYRWKKVK